MSKTIFHGGCIGCTMQDAKGLGYCTGCQYFEGHWRLPDLNNKHIEEEIEMSKIRNKAHGIVSAGNLLKNTNPILMLNENNH